VDGFVVSLDGSSAPATAAAAERLLREGKLLWLDLHSTDDETTGLLRDVFQFHPVAMEDVAEWGQRPKAENFDEVVYLVCYAATTVLGELTEVHFFFAKDYLVTIRRDGSDPLDEIRKRLAAADGPQRSGNRPLRAITLHEILDTMIDSFFPALSDLDDRIDELLEKIFEKPSKDELASLLGMQRWLVMVRKLVTPQRDLMAGLVSGVVVLPGRTAESDPYLRDLYDHVIRISDLIDSYRDLLSNGMDAYLSMVSNKLNEITKQLTVIATVFLPLSFLTGFFGQNFGWLVSHLGSLGTFLGFGIGTEVIAIAGLYLLFRKRGWV
jgi:magnesium transporter